MNAEIAQQDAVFCFLGEPATHGGAAVKRYDTHAAVGFLAGDRAIKVKRAVRFPFLDYSTLTRRKAACLAELEVNRRFAPQLYRRVVPITRDADGSMAFDGKGEPIEWAVEMSRFDESKTLDHLADRGALDDGLMSRLAVAVAAMHERAMAVEAAPWLQALRTFVARNTAAFREHRDLFRAECVDDLDRKSMTALARLRPLLQARGRLGLIRRGHGDLHLGNIAVIDGEPVAFDALEFDAIVASGDLLYDLAFLLMDLVDRDLHRAANIVFNGYFGAARRSDNYEGLAALPFFMSLRAAIRANVTAERCAIAAAEDRPAAAQSARRYFDLALKLLASAKPAVIGIGGLSGTGKSVLARALAPALPPSPGALVLRSDVERKAMFGTAETERLPSDKYRPEVSAAVYRFLNEKAARIARAGHSVVVDAVFAKPEERAAIEQAVADIDADFHGLFLVADLQSRLERIGTRGPDASDADADVAKLQEGFSIGANTWTIIDGSGSPEETLGKAYAVPQLQRHAPSAK